MRRRSTSSHQDAPYADGVISATSRTLGRRWPVSTVALAVDAEQCALDLCMTQGVAVRNHIVVQPVDAARCRISFG